MVQICSCKFVLVQPKIMKKLPSQFPLWFIISGLELQACLRCPWSWPWCPFKSLPLTLGFFNGSALWKILSLLLDFSIVFRIVFVIVCFCFSFSASKHPLVPDSILVSSFSPNLLLIFLFCNLLTGAVNMSIDTVQQSTVTSMIILIAYSLILCFIALGIHFHGEKLKFR